MERDEPLDKPLENYHYSAAAAVFGFSASESADLLKFQLCPPSTRGGGRN